MESCISKALASLSNQSQEDKNQTVTENGAAAYVSTLNSCLDLFASSVRNTPEEKIRSLVSKSWEEDRVKTLAILMHLRDCRGGKGEKTIFYYALLWLRENHPRVYLANLPTFVNQGYYKDLCYLVKMLHAKGSSKLGSTTWIELEYLAELFQKDLALLETSQKSITLVGKWLPSESSHFDAKENGNQAGILARLLFPADLKKTAMRKYRKALTQTRENLRIVEKLLSEKRYSEINFNSVPAKAHKILRKAFVKNAPEAYAEFLSKVKKGEAKINSTGLQPHELVEKIRKQPDETIESLWTDLANKLRSAGTLTSSLAVCDVSGSMEGTPMQVAIALGILVSDLVEGPFSKQLITFSETPELHRVEGETLYDKVGDVSKMKWGMNTDLMAVFKLMLNFAKFHQVKPENMPKTLFIFTDMQFDMARANNKIMSWQTTTVEPWKSTYSSIVEMYSNDGYTVPNIVFWNLRDTKPSFPVTADTPGVSLISGFSAEMLKLFLTGDLSQMTPTSMMNLALEPYLELVQGC